MRTPRFQSIQPRGSYWGLRWRGRFTSFEPSVPGCRPLPRSSAWAHTHGIRLRCYLEDWLVLSSSERGAKQSVQSLLSHCRTLRIVINEKSDLVPSQTAKYLGMTIDTEAGKVLPSLARVEKFLTVAESFCTMDVPLAQLWQVILGHLASLERLVPHGRLWMRTVPFCCKV